MMYRLNHAQGQKLSLTTEQQQQSSQQQSQQHQQQVIPSHILLQQQLDAATTSAAVAASNAGDTNVFIANFAGSSSAEADIGNSSSSSNSTSARNLLHLQQHHVTTRQLNNNVSNIVISSVDTLANASVEERLKLLKTAIKSEPVHDISTSSNQSSSSNLSSVVALNTNCKEELISLAACSALANIAPSSSALKGSNLALKTSAGIIANNINPSGSSAQVTITATGSAGSSSSGVGCGADVTNGGLVFVPSKRARLDP